jgi:hypothetical protein
MPIRAKTVNGVEAKVIIASFNAAPRTGIAASGRTNGLASALMLRIQPRFPFAPAARRRAGSKRWKKSGAITSSGIGDSVETSRVAHAPPPRLKPAMIIGGLLASNPLAPIDIESVWKFRCVCSIR